MSFGELAGGIYVRSYKAKPNADCAMITASVIFSPKVIASATSGKVTLYSCLETDYVFRVLLFAKSVYFYH